MRDVFTRKVLGSVFEVIVKNSKGAILDETDRISATINGILGFLQLIVQRRD